MTLEERNEFTKNLEKIYDAARKKVDRLRQKRRETFRANQTIEEVSVHIAEKRAVVRKAHNKIFAHIENVESAYLPTLATRYFHELSNLRHEVIALKQSTESLRVELIEKARRLRHELTKRSELRDQLQDAKLQLRTAKLDRQKGAAIKHKENRAMKAEVFLWLDENRSNFKSMDKTAEAVTKQQPIAFRTARDWVGDWKKQGHASTP